jgi:hypothetical protein
MAGKAKLPDRATFLSTAVVDRLFRREPRALALGKSCKIKGLQARNGLLFCDRKEVQLLY